jgi:GNAT superfamily N-acetyltransferase
VSQVRILPGPLMSEPPAILVRPGRSDEAAALSALALRSKAHWGYDAAFLEACRAELTLAPGEVIAERVTVAEVEGLVAGFVSLAGTPPEGEISFLFVDPPSMGRGVGRALFAAAVDRARSDRFRALSVEADPDAEAFYLRMGARCEGSVSSRSIPGRVLPRLRYDLP